MAVEHQKATSITNLDATPIVRGTSGIGTVGTNKRVSNTVVMTASASVDSTVQLVRVPFGAILKSIDFWGKDQGTTGQFDLGVYYATDGSNALSVATLLAAAAIDQDFFGTAFVSDGATGFYARIVPGMGLVVEVATPRLIAPAWSPTDGELPLWSALGLSANPGGNADIVATVQEAIDTGAAIGIVVDYVEV